MKIRTKLIGLCLLISMVPVLVVGAGGLQNMESVGSYAQDQSATHLEDQITGELNNTVGARQEEFENLFDVRRVDARSLAESTPVQNYQAASAGEMELIQHQSRQQVGYVALQMHSTVESTKRTILDEEYDGRDWEELTDEEQRRVKAKTERVIAGTSGNGTDADGTMSQAFQPGYIGDTGYAQVTDGDSNVVVHHSLPDGYNYREDGSLAVYDDIRANARSDSEIRNGEAWGIAEYEWQDTTQEGNPVEQMFVAYAYHEDFDWILSPSVFYYELQTTAVNDAKDGINESFESYLDTRSVTVDGTEMPAYDEILLTDKNGRGVLRAHRSGDEVVTESVEAETYGDAGWFLETSLLDQGEVHFGEVQTVDGKSVMYVTTPVYHDNLFAGYIALRFNYDIFSEITNDVTVGDNGHLSIVNDNGRILSHPESSVVENQTYITDEDYAGTLANVSENRILEGERGLTTYETTASGERAGRYVAYAPIEIGDKRMSLLATVPEEDVTGPSLALGRSLSDRTTAARDFLLALIGGVVVVAVAVGYGSARYISTPIERLRDRAKLLADGRFDDEVDISAPDDEVGELVDAFSDMQGNLRRQVTELRSVSENLGAGELDREVRTDFPGEFGAIMTDIEEGVEQLQEGFDEIRRTSQQIRDGKLDQDVDTELPGEYGAVLADLDAGVQQLADSFDQIRSASSQLREGDFDQELETDLPGQYGAVMDDVETGLTEIGRSLAEVRDVADRFAALSTETAASTEEIESASREIADSVEEIAHGAGRQTEQLQAASNEMNSLSATIEEVASSADGVVDTATEAVELADQGREYAADATAEISEIESEADTAVEQVESLGDQVTEINEMVQLIQRIAEQTNLLALNASIEAARAGEAGEGFAVVADEIKALANEAEAATEEVEVLTHEIQQSADETVGEMQSMQDSVETGTETIGSAIEMFDHIDEAVRDAEHGIEEISAATEEQSVSTEEVVTMVDDISSVSEETASEASTVSAATEQQAAVVDEVAGNVQRVSRSAKSLRELVGQFEVGERDEATVESEPDDVTSDGGLGETTTQGDDAAVSFDDRERPRPGNAGESQ
ncbi:methyl-accepting chemotaxis protein [Halorussus amylolyticus]|uniref:methyl-accepting chemotaxis protein n=1 Tax=Halorussus amylolyticus TaxID=1126242 RepID=UPI00104D668D|nr:methyl-accepting chemotaxis protein [Halorussus amylolyticus]